MSYILPIASLGVSVFVIITTPWPTANEMWTTPHQQRMQEVVDYLDPLTIARKNAQ